MIPYLLAVVGGYFIGSSMKDETPSISNFGYGGEVIEAPKNYVFVKFSSHRSREKAISRDIKYVSLYTFGGNQVSAGTSINFMSDADYRKIKDIVGVSIVKNLKGIWFSRNEDEKLDKKIYPILQKYHKFNDGGVMANGGYVKNYNVFGKVKVLVHDYADETEYETTDFSINVMALNEQEAMVMVEEQLMDEYLLNDYGTSMLGYKVHYTGEVDIEDVVEIKE